MAKIPVKSTITTFALAMLITGSVDNIRNLPAMGMFGTELPFFFIMACLFFLIPAAFISARLVFAFPATAGIYDWVGKAFSPKWSVVAVWLQWINTMVWFPTILSFVAATLCYLINPSWSEQPKLMMLMVDSSFWLVTIVALRGLRLSAKFASLCTIFGMVAPLLIIIFCAGYWLWQHNHIAINFGAGAHWWPNLHRTNSWASLTAIVTSFLGMELAAVHARRLANPAKKLPRALLLSVLLIVVTVLPGAMAVCVILPTSQLSLVEGVMQAFQLFFAHFHMTWALKVMAFMLVLGSAGGLVNWVISPAGGLLRAAEENYLPRSLAALNKHQVPWRILVLQAILVTLVSTAFLLVPSVSGTYWLLTVLSTEIYLVMYLLLFISSWRLLTKENVGGTRPHVTFAAIRLWSIFGIIGVIVTLVVGFLPPSGIAVGPHYVRAFSLGLVILLSPLVRLIYSGRLSTKA